MSIEEQEYLEHYGRKGMKWYQHIFTEDRIRNGITRWEYKQGVQKRVSKTHKIGVNALAATSSMTLAYGLMASNPWSAMIGGLGAVLTALQIADKPRQDRLLDQKIDTFFDANQKQGKLYLEKIMKK